MQTINLKKINLKNSAYYSVLYLSWSGLFALLFYKSWICEDAYITFRVIDNFINGYGLRWNITERVQAYTHPLWLLLHLPFAFFWKNLFFLNIALSLLCSALAVGITLLTFRKNIAAPLILFMLPLFLSKSFIDYAGSGLETPLSFMLFAMLGYVLLHLEQKNYFTFLCALLISLLLLNRLDHLLLLAPLIISLAMQLISKFSSSSSNNNLKIREIIMLILGLMPLIFWFSFSLFYYGFLFPNTKYAKLDTGLPVDEYLAQGAHYLFLFLAHDTASATTVFVAIALAIAGKIKNSAKFKSVKSKSVKSKYAKFNSAEFNSAESIYFLLAIGLILNIAYVVWIGGDYMMGRFLAFIFFVSVWLLLAISPEKPRFDILFAFMTLIITACFVSYGVREIRGKCEACIPIHGRVIDARMIFNSNSLFTNAWPPRVRTEGQYKFAYQGRDLAKENPPPIKPMMYIGMAPYYAGAQAIFIDELALADPLLARLPARTDRPFYVGHYRRMLPKGYLEAIRDGKLEGMHPDLAFYYSKLRLITRGELWNYERLMTIIRFNFGQYDHDLRKYLATAHNKKQ